MAAPGRDRRHSTGTYARVYEAARQSRPQSPKAFLLATARHFMVDRIPRERIVSIRAGGDIEYLNVLVDEISPEQLVGAHQELARVARAFDRLTAKCREVVWAQASKGAIPEGSCQKARTCGKDHRETLENRRTTTGTLPARGRIGTKNTLERYRRHERRGSPWARNGRTRLKRLRAIGSFAVTRGNGRKPIQRVSRAPCCLAQPCGYGDPLRRDPRRVMKDIADRLISPERARRVLRGGARA